VLYCRFMASAMKPQQIEYRQRSKHMRLLSIDWDFFFPVPHPKDDPRFMYDWNHAERGRFFLETIWGIRAAQFLASDTDLPGTSGEEEDFWERFCFSDNPVLHYADSHVMIYKPEVMFQVDEVYNYDAHHDAFDSVEYVIGKGSVDCGNWATGYYIAGIDIYTVYPRWKAWMMEDEPQIDVNPSVDTGNVDKRKFDRVFICRSGSWTPPWIEEQFWKFLENCPVKTRVRVDDITRRELDMEEVRANSETLRRSMKEVVQ
jgi:hypothetical protein